LVIKLGFVLKEKSHILVIKISIFSIMGKKRAQDQVFEAVIEEQEFADQSLIMKKGKIYCEACGKPVKWFFSLKKFSPFTGF
jgi:hypothetical protein